MTVSASTALPRVTFGIMVLNGQPFTRYCLRSLYPYAHEIIVVEGGHEDARAVTTPDGHSIDGTLEVLRRFKEEEDPQDKVQIVTRDGFWPKTDEYGNHRTHQSRAYAERATGDYLWQVDIDEFYLPRDMARVLDMLARDPVDHVGLVQQPAVLGWPGLHQRRLAVETRRARDPQGVQVGARLSLRDPRASAGPRRAGPRSPPAPLGGRRRDGPARRQDVPLLRPVPPPGPRQGGDLPAREAARVRRDHGRGRSTTTCGSSTRTTWSGTTGSRPGSSASRASIRRRSCG